MVGYKFVILKANLNKEGKTKLLLRITIKGTRKYLEPTLNHHAIYLSIDEYNAIGHSRSKKLKSINQFILDEEIRIEKILSKISVFTFQKFADKYHTSELLSDGFSAKIKELHLKDKISSKNGYRDAMNAFVKYANIKLSDIDQDYIDGFIEYRNTYPSTYLRYLRHIIIRSGSPFKFKIKNVSKKKFPLLQWELEAIKKYKTPYATKQKHIDFWLLSYNCGGMNTKDWVWLKYEHLKGDILHKGRSKTGQEQVHVINSKAKEIITKYSRPGDYVFGIINDNMSPIQKETRYRTLMNNLRTTLNRLEKELQFTSRLTPYVARHTHGAILMDQGYTVKEISDSYGHGSTKTTEIYLHSMGIKKKKKMSEGL